MNGILSKQGSRELRVNIRGVVLFGGDCEKNLEGQRGNVVWELVTRVIRAKVQVFGRLSCLVSVMGTSDCIQRHKNVVKYRKTLIYVFTMFLIKCYL